VEAMWRVLQADEARDWVVATGETHSVREFITDAFAYAGITLEWEGHGLDEIGVCVETGRVYVRVNPAFFRPAEVDLLLGDSTEIRTKLGWSPTFTFDQLVKDMMDAVM